jgi:hypothetical protein
VRETFGDGFILMWSPTWTGPTHMHLYHLAEMAESETLVSLIDSFGEQLSQVFMLRVFDVDTIC